MGSTFSGLTVRVDAQLGGVIDHIAVLAVDVHARDIGVECSAGELFARHEASTFITGSAVDAAYCCILEAQDGHHVVELTFRNNFALVRRDRDVT